MNRAGNQLFSRSGLAEQQDSGIAGSDSFNQLQNVL
jgi:hypothetical protein